MCGAALMGSWGEGGGGATGQTIKIMWSCLKEDGERLFLVKQQEKIFFNCGVLGRFFSPPFVFLCGSYFDVRLLLVLCALSCMLYVKFLRR